MAERAGSVLWKLSLGGKEVDIKDIVQFTVDKDLNQPDMAVAVLRNTSHTYVAQAKIGDPFEIESTLPGTNALKLLFKGDISGIEPQYKGGGESRVTVRAFCMLHKKLQGKKSKTFQDKTDQQIITDVLGQIEWKGPQENPTYKHITQDNMTDLDFARLRASRIGCYIWSENGKIMVKVPELDKDSGVEFKVYDKQEGDHRIKSFAPRLTGAQIVKGRGPRVEPGDQEGDRREGQGGEVVARRRRGVGGRGHQGRADAVHVRSADLGATRRRSASRRPSSPAEHTSAT